MANLRHGDRGHFAETEKKGMDLEARLAMSYRAMCVSWES